MLSGGAGFGKFHYGLIKALAEQDLVPKVICGSSAGSLVAASLSTLKFDEVAMIQDFDLVLGKNVIGWNRLNNYDLMQDFI